MYGQDRAEAIARMNRALSMFVVEGIHTSIPLHQRIIADPDFQAGEFDTGLIPRLLAKKAVAYLRKPPPLLSNSMKNDEIDS